MICKIGIENSNEGYRTIAWALEHPGCFAYGVDAGTALSAMKKSYLDYEAWIASHEHPWFQAQECGFMVEEIFEDYDIDDSFDRVEKGSYAVEPFFLHDWKPLTGADIERGLKLLSWSRADLLAAVAGLEAGKLTQTYPGERWSIAGILGHIGGAEWWYLDRLGLAFPRGDVPAEPFERLERVRAMLIETLPKLEETNQVVGIDGEFWSPRKILRRAAWHERDHTEHICKLIE